jgi:hypothetical protein
MNTAGEARGNARWLLVFNCQALGLANCIRLAAPGLELDYCDFPRFRKDPGEYLGRIDQYDLIVTAPQFHRTEYADFSALGPTRLVPTMVFDAYHPDLCNVVVDDRQLKGPLGDYHSSLVVVAYRQGLSAADTERLFGSRMYEALGYFDRWADARQRLLGGFAAHGYDIAPAFQKWSRGAAAFMHSVNHPAIGCLRDVAGALVRAAGIEDAAQHLVPHDNLLNGPVFPVYEEIAEHYSVEGSYRFKLGGEYRHIGLREFIRASFEAYDAAGRHRIEVHAMYQRLHQRILHAL